MSAQSSIRPLQPVPIPPSAPSPPPGSPVQGFHQGRQDAQAYLGLIMFLVRLVLGLMWLLAASLAATATTLTRRKTGLVHAVICGPLAVWLVMAMQADAMGRPEHVLFRVWFIAIVIMAFVHFVQGIRRFYFPGRGHVHRHSPGDVRPVIVRCWLVVVTVMEWIVGRLVRTAIVRMVLDRVPRRLRVKAMPENWHEEIRSPWMAELACLMGLIGLLLLTQVVLDAAEIAWTSELWAVPLFPMFGMAVAALMGLTLARFRLMLLLDQRIEQAGLSEQLSRYSDEMAPREAEGVATMPS